MTYSSQNRTYYGAIAFVKSLIDVINIDFSNLFPISLFMLGRNSRSQCPYQLVCRIGLRIELRKHKSHSDD